METWTKTCVTPPVDPQPLGLFECKPLFTLIPFEGKPKRATYCPMILAVAPERSCVAPWLQYPWPGEICVAALKRMLAHRVTRWVVIPMEETVLGSKRKRQTNCQRRAFRISAANGSQNDGSSGKSSSKDLLFGNEPSMVNSPAHKYEAKAPGY